MNIKYNKKKILKKWKKINLNKLMNSIVNTKSENNLLKKKNKKCLSLTKKENSKLLEKTESNPKKKKKKIIYS
jgi:hypothetical protein